MTVGLPSSITGEYLVYDYTQSFYVLVRINENHRKLIIFTNHTRENETHEKNIDGLYELLACVAP